MLNSQKEIDFERLRLARCETDSRLKSLQRALSLPFTRIFIFLGISPNAISLLALAFSIAGAWAFTEGIYAGFLAGGVFTFFASMLDCCDGQVARVTGRETNFGCWLDSFGDYLSYLVIFGGIFLGAARSGQLPGLWAVVSIFSGCLISIGVFVHYRYRLAKLDGQPDRMDVHFFNAMKQMAGDPLIRLAHALSKLPARSDLSFLILGFVLFGQIKAFLIFISVAVHLVWILTLYVGRKAEKNGFFGSIKPLAEWGILN